MFTFRTSITFAVMTFVVALAALLIAIQARLFALGHAGSRVRLYGRRQHQGIRPPSGRTKRDRFAGECAGDQFECGRFE